MNYIRKAMQRLPGHWHQGDFFDEFNPVMMCGLGHLRTVVGEERGTPFGWCKDSGWDELNKVAREQYPDRLDDGRGGFPQFNDHPDTTEDEVLAVMEKAAIMWEENYDNS